MRLILLLFLLLTNNVCAQGLMVACEVGKYVQITFEPGISDSMFVYESSFGPAQKIPYISEAGFVWTTTFAPPYDECWETYRFEVSTVRMSGGQATFIKDSIYFEVQPPLVKPREVTGIEVSDSVGGFGLRLEKEIEGHIIRKSRVTMVTQDTSVTLLLDPNPFYDREGGSSPFASLFSGGKEDGWLFIEAVSSESVSISAEMLAYDPTKNEWSFFIAKKDLTITD